MKKLALVAALSSLATVAATQALSGAAVKQTPRGSYLYVINAETLFRPFADGGMTAEFRACGHESTVMPDGGLQRVGEPCWKGDLPATVAADLARALLAQGAAR